VLHSSLEITGNSNQSYAITGQIREFREPRGITKTGTSAITLSGNNTYTGDTAVLGGTLSINNPCLADTADVYLAAGATFNLNFIGADTIDSLFINGIGKVTGAWGGPGSGATNISNLLSGTGTLLVSSIGATPGDFDGDLDVDANDFAAWKGGYGTASGATRAGGDSDGDGDADADDFLAWQGAFGGLTSSNPATPAAGAVPEPATALQVCAAGLAAVVSRLRAGRSDGAGKGMFRLYRLFRPEAPAARAVATACKDR
jgi:autotransporter-associated beta strand protein